VEGRPFCVVEAVQANRLNAEAFKHRRENSPKRRVAVVADDLEPLTSAVIVEEAEIICLILLYSAAGKLDLTQIIRVGTFEVLPEKGAFHLSFHASRKVGALRVKHFNEGDPRVSGQFAYAHRSCGPASLDEVARNRQCRAPHIEDVASHAQQRSNNRSFDHSRTARGVATRDDFAPVREAGTKGGSQTAGKIRRNLNIAQSGNAKLTEQVAAPLAAPDKRHGYNRPSFNDLVGPEFDSRTNGAADVYETPVSDDRILSHNAISLNRCTRAEDGGVNAYVWTDIGAVPYNGSLDVGFLFDKRIISDDGVRSNRRARLDLAVSSEADRRNELGGVIDHTIGSDRNSVSDGLTLHGKVHLSRQHVFLRFTVLAQRADVGPILLHDVAEHGLAFGKQPRENIAAPVVRLVRLHVREYLGFENVHAGVYRVGEDLRPTRLFEESDHFIVIVGNHDAEFKWIGHPVQNKGRKTAFSFVKLDRLGQVAVGERIAGYDDKGAVLEKTFRLLNTPGSTQRRCFDAVAHLDAEILAIAEIALDLFRKVVKRCDDIVDSMPFEERNDVLHNRLIADRNHRLGSI